MSANRTHQLIKLRSDTVENLKRLRLEMGQGSLNSLVMVMIKQTEAHRSKLKNSGWD